MLEQANAALFKVMVPGDSGVGTALMDLKGRVVISNRTPDMGPKWIEGVLEDRATLASEKITTSPFYESNGRSYYSMILPVRVDGEFHGNLVFADDSPERRNWTATEIGTLKTGNTTILGTYAFDGNGSIADRLTVTGNLTITGATLAINAINPLITIFGFSLASLLAGALLTESVFGWPGLGVLTFDALVDKDEPLVMASVVMLVLMLVIGNLIADVLLAIIDPRIRLD